MPEYTADTDAFGTLKLLEAIINNNLKDITRFYQASTSELYGLVQEVPQKETTPFYPRSPYGVAKLYAYWIVKNYRESYNLFACNGILFNHEGERRGHNFVTRKITLGLNNILKGKASKLVMGNLDSLRDWGSAKDYVEGMWRILQHDTPEDFVLATGEMHSIKEFIEEAFRLKGFNIKWKGDEVDEIGYDEKTGKELIFVDPKYFRPAEVSQLLGDPTKAKTLLGWTPKITFKELVREMVEHDCK
jgi:GDPmannose 4,6-dehydratase